MAAGIRLQIIDNAALLLAVSKTAVFPAYLEIPTSCVRFSSLKTEIPFWISFYLIKTELQTPAPAEAAPATTEFNKNNFLPDAEATIGPVSFLMQCATNKAELKAET